MIDKENIRIRSEKANEILGTPPHFVVRSGIVLITITLLLILSTSLIIKYPDLISTRVTLTGPKNPVSIVAEKSEIIENILVKEGEFVQKGQALAVWENGTDYRSICSMKAFSDSVKAVISSGRSEISFNDTGKNQGAISEELSAAFDKLKDLAEAYNKLSSKGYKTNGTVNFQPENIRSKDKLIQTIKQSVGQLDEELKNWEQTWLIKAEIPGNISFYKLWSEKQLVAQGDELMIIIPETSGVYGFSYIPVAGSGKIKVGQQVNIKLDQYPSEEFGTIKGIVSSVSSYAKDDQYIIQISLPQGLTTSYGKVLDFKPEMKGETQIITEDLKLFDRIFNNQKKRF